MSKRSSLLLVTLLLLGCVLDVAWAQGPSAAGAPEARLATYDSSTGETFFALSLTPPPAPAAQESREIVVLFDTSASQTGLYRTDALAALKVLLGQLGEADRVQLMAADLNALPLSNGFVPPRGAEMDAALAKLEQRTPLGSTDLAAALRTAADTFGKTQPAASAVVYLGDGVSRGTPAPGRRVCGRHAGARPRPSAGNQSGHWAATRRGLARGTGQPDRWQSVCRHG